MRGHVRHRGEERAGSWEYIIDIGLAAAQRCETCNKRFWVERRPQASCPKCAGALRETEERRRETKSGFATQKECQAAMNKLLVAVEQHNYTAPTKLTLPPPAPTDPAPVQGKGGSEQRAVLST